jgi:hypothetical protein
MNTIGAASGHSIPTVTRDDNRRGRVAAPSPHGTGRDAARGLRVVMPRRVASAAGRGRGWSALPGGLVRALRADIAALWGWRASLFTFAPGRVPATGGAFWWAAVARVEQ